MFNETYTNIISEVIAERIKAGMTQKELAKKMGTSQSSIARLEGGNINPTFAFVDRIATELGMKMTIHLG